MQNLRTWAEINLSNVKNNFNSIKNRVGNTKIMSVVKADAYGHGSVEVSKALEEAGSDYFAVACIDEAIKLRSNGISKPILVLSYIQDDRILNALQNDITFTVYTYEYAKKISDLSAINGFTGKIHIKIDTGMGRIGFLYGYSDKDDTDTLESIINISRLPCLDVEGIFTHFSSSDEENTDKTYLQFGRFTDIINKLSDNGVCFKLKHCCNSAAIIRFPEMYLDMVRPGIILYGCYPSEICDNGSVEISPAMSLKTSVINMKTVDEGFGISYGEIYFTEGRTKIATIPIGYADGFSRLNSNRLSVGVNGQKAKIIGRICMDQCMIDVTDVNNISVGDYVTVFGSDNDLKLPVENLSDICGTINYEILCNIGKRVPRVYFG